MDYTKQTVRLLLERHPSYLEEVLRSRGWNVNVQNETAESISAIVTCQKHVQKKAHESSIYTCQCGSKSVVTREVQMRSADEGSTIVHICNDCGRRY